MRNMTSTDMIIVCILIAVILVLIGIIFIIDILNKRKQVNSFAERREVQNENKKEDAPIVAFPDIELIDNNVTKPVSNRIEEIKYVEENEELEKTQAKIELNQLKEELRRQEENKKEKIIENINETPEIAKEEKVEVSEIAEAINEELSKENQEANLEKVNAVQEDLNELLQIGIEDKIMEHEDAQEKEAIISVEEFNKISDELYDSNEVVQNTYGDEGNEPISLSELESLYNTRELQTVKLDDFNTINKDDEVREDIKKLEDLPPIAAEKKFKSSPFISPVYGISEKEDSIELEQTADFDKLNEEIKKTNEFLKVLKELQKNLD